MFYLSAMLLAPILPAFAYMQYGWSNNHEEERVEPRLPKWLNWYMTPDNSLYGDRGWRLEHCPKYWETYIGQVLWLWRNAACGFAWSVLSKYIGSSERFLTSTSGCGLSLDKSRGESGWFKITCSNGAFQYRYVSTGKYFQFSFEAGWLLDVYVKDPVFGTHNQPRAPFSFQPQLRRRQ